MSALTYLDELDAKSTDWQSRVQIACAQAIIEAIAQQTVTLKTPIPAQAPPIETWCPACQHDRHRSHCTARLGWLRRFLRRHFSPNLGEECGCSYWDADWEGEE